MVETTQLYIIKLFFWSWLNKHELLEMSKFWGIKNYPTKYKFWTARQKCSVDAWRLKGQGIESPQCLSFFCSEEWRMKNEQRKHEVRRRKKNINLEVKNKEGTWSKVKWIIITIPRDSIGSTIDKSLTKFCFDNRCHPLSISPIRTKSSNPYYRN